MRRTSAALVAAAALTAAAVVGGRSGPTPNHPVTAAWYARLRKPSFTPPGPVFGAAWGVLYILLGYAGYRLLGSPRRPARSVALGAWWATVLGVGGFSWVLFGRRRTDEALGVNAAMVGSSVALVVSAAEADPPAALAALPLAAWVVFACVLQEEVWRRNR
jgi:tryptophan-rich sensory protein